MRTWCFMTKDFNGGHHHGQQVWRRIKIFLACHWHGPRSTLTDCKVCGGQSVGGRRESMMYGNISKCPPNSIWPTLYGCVNVFRARLSTFVRKSVEMGECGSYKGLMLDTEWTKWCPPSRPPGMTQLKDFHNFCSSRHEDDNWVDVKTVVFKLEDKMADSLLELADFFVCLLMMNLSNYFLSITIGNSQVCDLLGP